MPVTVSCSCGKQLKVKDELIGKRVRCPACGNTFPVTPAGNAPAGATVFNPSAAAAAKGKREAAAGKVSISWGPVIGVGVVVLVGIGIAAFLMGPKKVWNQWEEIGDQAKYDVTDVVNRGLQAHLSKHGLYNPRKGNTTSPQVTDVMFFRPTMVMSMPDKVDLNGVTNQGPFKGTYNPHKREVDCELALGGGIGIPGSGGKKEAGEKIHITGRVTAAGMTAEVDGKNAVLVMPPITDE
jgi:hypothetical protein